MTKSAFSVVLDDELMTVSVLSDAEGNIPDDADVYFSFKGEPVFLSDMDIHMLDVTERVLREHMFMVDYNAAYRESSARFDSAMSAGMFGGLVAISVAHWLIPGVDSSLDLYSFLIVSCVVFGLFSLRHRRQIKKNRSANEQLHKVIEQVEDRKRTIINDLNG